MLHPTSKNAGIGTFTRWRALFAPLVCSLMLAGFMIFPMQASAALYIGELSVPTGSSQPTGITQGPNGALWFAESGGNKIGRCTTAGDFIEFTVPTGGSWPRGITAGPDGALWFTETIGNKIGRCTTAGDFIEFTVPTGGSSPTEITAGPDGALWFTESTGNKIGRCTTTGAITEFTVPTGGSSPTEITAGPDGALWFTESTVNKIGRCTTAGAITEFTVPTGGSSPRGITAGPDGALWFTEFTGNKIGRCTTAGAITEFTVPTGGSSPRTITAGSDGALWFVEYIGNKIGRCTTAGIITENTVPTANSQPHGIVAGPDAAIWFTEQNANKLGRVGVPFSAWYLAEVSTACGYSAYITIENSYGAPLQADVTYMPTGAAPVTVPNVNLPAMSQTTLNPRDTVGDADFSTRVVCHDPDRTIAVDRTMTWTGAGAPSEEGHNSAGVTSPSTVWYLPEGSTEWGFECWLCIQNPDPVQPAHCTVTYMIENAGPVSFNKTVGPHTRETFNVAKDIGAKDASIQVTSDVGVIPERAMYRNNRREGHDSIGTTSPAYDFYLAEGTTAWGFTTYVCVQNPNTTPVDVTLIYNTAQMGPQPQVPFTMQPGTRKTIRVNDVMPNVDFSTRVHGSGPIIAERAMYWNNGTGEATHDSIGMPFAHHFFLLPDGQTSDGRETWTCVQNPNTDKVNIQIGYLTPDGIGFVMFNDEVPAGSRKSYNMAERGINGRAAIFVVADKPIMVERAMYWNSRGAGTDTIGGFSD
jgi:virginiamycin B lyase